MLGKKYEDRSVFDHSDEFAWHMETFHGDREKRRDWYLVNDGGKEYLELWSERWGGRKRLAVRAVLNRFTHAGTDYIMIFEGGRSVYRYSRSFFGNRVTLHDVDPDLERFLKEEYAPEKNTEGPGDKIGRDAAGRSRVHADRTALSPEQKRQRVRELTEKFFSQFEISKDDDQEGAYSCYDRLDVSGEESTEQDMFAVIFTNDSDVCDVSALKLIASYADETRQIEPLFPEDQRDAYKCFAAFFETSRINIIDALDHIGYDAENIGFEIFRVVPSELLSGIRELTQAQESDATGELSLQAKRAKTVCDRLISLGYFDTEEDIGDFLETEYLQRFHDIIIPVMQLVSAYHEAAEQDR